MWNKARGTTFVVAIVPVTGRSSPSRPPFALTACGVPAGQNFTLSFRNNLSVKFVKVYLKLKPKLILLIRCFFELRDWSKTNSRLPVLGFYLF